MDPLDTIARHVPGFGVYGPTLLLQGTLGHGRIRAMQEGVIFQHLLILRREMVQDAGLNFYTVEEQATKIIGKKRLAEYPPLHGYLLMYAAFRQVVHADKETLRAILG